MAKEVIWRWTDACTALGLPASNGPAITGISIDTRTLEPGDLFVALSGDPGPRFHTDSRSARDGHDYVADAQRGGAAGVMTHRDTRTALPELRVADTLDGLWALGRAGRRRIAAPVFAVTGSSGKTTVRSFLAAALGVPATTGSLNNFWGVPLSLARTAASVPAAVFEIGTNHPGEIEPLAQLVNPTVALVLNVRPAHVEYFASIAELRREKLSIFAGLTPDGVAVLPDDLDAAELPHNVDAVTFGQSPGAAVRLTDYRPDERVATYRVRGRIHSARVPGGGVHRALSLAAVLACLTAAARPIESALNLPDSVVPTGRGSHTVIGGVRIIDDSYNANPASMAAALTSLATEPAQRSIAILGEMLELGDGSANYHRQLATHCGGIARIACVGAGMRALWDALPIEQRWLQTDAVDGLSPAEVAAILEPGDVVLVKGSNRVFWKHQFVQRLVQAIEQRLGGSAAANDRPR